MFLIFVRFLFGLVFERTHPLVSIRSRMGGRDSERIEVVVGFLLRNEPVHGAHRSPTDLCHPRRDLLAETHHRLGIDTPNLSEAHLIDSAQRHGASDSDAS